MDLSAYRGVRMSESREHDESAVGCVDQVDERGWYERVGSSWRSHAAPNAAQMLYGNIKGGAFDSPRVRKDHCEPLRNVPYTPRITISIHRPLWENDMKILHAAILLALPATLAAQQQSGAPAANPLTTVFRSRTIGLQRNLAQAFDSIPASKFGYKPTAAQLTVGYIAQHLAEDNYYFCNNFGSTKATLPEKDTTTPDSVKATWPKDTLVAKLKASFAFCENAFSQLDDAKLAEQVAVNPTRNATRASFVLGHDLDMADHYSQIANYMRLNNILPPTALPRPKP